MSIKMWHVIGVLLIGYFLGYKFSALGTATVGKLGIARG